MAPQLRAGGLSTSLVALMAVLAATPALAQGPAPAPATSPDDGEILVTAQKREQSLIDVPLAVQAFSGRSLEEQGKKELNDLIASIPGASSVSRTAPGFETIQIRGISSGTTGDATVGYYVDDVPFSVPNLQLAPPSRLFDLQRVEVLRGPQGTLYGQGAMGGTIRMITAAPDYDDVQARAQLEGSTTAGGKASYAIDGVLNLPVARDAVALRLSGGYESVGGFADLARANPGGGFTVTRKDVNGQESWNLRGKLGIKASDAVTVELGGWRVENRLDFRNTMDSADPPLFNDTTGPDSRPNYIKTGLTLLSGVINADLGGARLTSSTSWIDSLLDFDASFLYAPAFGSGYLRNDSRFATKAFTQEIRLASQGDGPFTWLVGGYYSDGRIKSDICLGLIAPCAVPFPPFNINSTGEIRTRAHALFGEAAYAALDGKLVFTVGGRYFNDRRRTSGVDRYTGAASPAQTATFDTFNPRFNISYKFTDSLLAYVNVAKGFRSGSFQTPAQAAAASAALGITIPTDVQPDQVWSYEVGLKGRTADGLLTIDAALYQIDWSDIQLQTSINGVATLSNGGNARSRGLDLGIILRPAEGLMLQASGNINDTVFTSVLPAIVALNPLAAPGSRIPGVPETSLTLNASYGWTIAAWDARANVSAGYIYRDNQLDSSGLVSDRLNEFNLRAGLDKNGWRLTLFADNLLNNRVALVRGALGIQPNFPRRIGARFAIDF